MAVVKEGQGIQMQCREKCPFYDEYARQEGYGRPCGNVFFGAQPCSSTSDRIREILKDGGKFRVRTTGNSEDVDYYRQDSKNSRREEWNHWYRVGTLRDGFFTPVVKEKEKQS